MQQKKSIIPVLILIFVSITFLSKCKDRDEIPFDKQKWLENQYSYQPTREQMAGDLIDNFLSKKLCYNELIDLLGSTANPKGQDLNHLYFQLQEVVESDAELLWVKYLDITVDKDSCYQSARILKLRL